jgi:uncharacterized protein YcbX
MKDTVPADAGRLAAIWRYPVKSMIGEQTPDADVGMLGIAGDRAYALIDRETGKVASAKNPRRWPNLFEFRAVFREPPSESRPRAAVQITFPDGTIADTDAPDIEARLAAAVGKPVRLARSPVDGASAEGYWPDEEWITARGETFEFTLPPGTFFDGASILLVTTSALAELSKSDPMSRFEPARFRPNFVIESPAGTHGFVENSWIGRTLWLGDVELRVDRPCERCVMTTLAQGDLPKDPGVLRTVVQRNGSNLGVYASVVQAGRVRNGDPVRLG